MYLLTANRCKRLVQITFIGRVTVADLQRGNQDLVELLSNFPANLRLLGDFERMESMEPGCAEELGRSMDTFDAHGVELIVRVIPDPSKDIGLNILSHFHYRKRPRIVTCKTMLEAAEALAL